jgi:CubicO group peptidase (beta-lactamase class C family)
MTQRIVDRLTTYMPRWMERERVPGCAVALVLDGATSWIGSFGLASVETGRPVDAGTVFSAASLTKPVFATLALNLHDRGVIDLDRPLVDYLVHPKLAEHPLLPLMTGRHVLCHATGMPNWASDEKDKQLKIKFTPGSAFGYSGEGFEYLQRVIEQVTGETTEDLIQREVLRPLGMADSTFRWNDGYADRYAGAHDSEGKEKPHWHPSMVNAAYSLLTTPAEYARFVIHWMAPRWASALAPANRVSEHVAWSMGWGVQVNDLGSAFFHWGDNGGYKNFILAYPERRAAVVVMTNGARGLRLAGPTLRTALGGSYPVFGEFLRPYYGRAGWRKSC